MLPQGKQAFLNYKNKKKQQTTKKLIFHLKGFIYKGKEKQSTGRLLDPESQAAFYFPKFVRGRMPEVKPAATGWGSLKGLQSAEQEGVLQTPPGPQGHCSVSAPHVMVKCALDSLEDQEEGPSEKSALQRWHKTRETADSPHSENSPLLRTWTLQ